MCDFISSVRRATAADAEAILHGINEVCAEEVYFSTPHYIPTPQWEAVLHRPEEVPDHLLYVAEQGKGFVGAVQILPCSASSASKPRGELGIFVLAPFRNQGIGRSLLRTILKEAKYHYREIILYVHSENDRAIHCFCEFGFSETGRRYHHYSHLGMQEQVFMVKRLNSDLGECSNG